MSHAEPVKEIKYPVYGWRKLFLPLSCCKLKNKITFCSSWFFLVNLYIKKTFINARRLFGTPFNYIPQGYRSYQVPLPSLLGTGSKWLALFLFSLRLPPGNRIYGFLLFVFLKQTLIDLSVRKAPSQFFLYQIYVPEPVPRCGGQLRAFEIPALAGVVRIK